MPLIFRVKIIILIVYSVISVNDKVRVSTKIIIIIFSREALYFLFIK